MNQKIDYLTPEYIYRDVRRITLKTIVFDDINNINLAYSENPLEENTEWENKLYAFTKEYMLKVGKDFKSMVIREFKKKYFNLYADKDYISKKWEEWGFLIKGTMISLPVLSEEEILNFSKQLMEERNEVNVNKITSGCVINYCREKGFECGNIKTKKIREWLRNEVQNGNSKITK